MADIVPQAIGKLGKMLGFRLRVSAMVKGGKYYGAQKELANMKFHANKGSTETEWRKDPKYQGGFVLDGGIHSIAGLRLLMNGAGEEVTRVSAFTNQLQKHLVRPIHLRFTFSANSKHSHHSTQSTQPANRPLA